jgi:hypothetical protein
VAVKEAAGTGRDRSLKLLLSFFPPFADIWTRLAWDMKAAAKWFVTVSRIRRND